MSDGTGQLRSELEGILQPPIDVLLDPSLLVAKASAEKVEGSQLVEAQTQATLGTAPSEPRLGDLHIPASFAELVNGDSEVPVSESASLEFFRGKAAPATEEQIADIVSSSLISPFASSDSVSPPLEENLAGRTRQILSEEMSFLQDGGIVLARTPTFLEAIRDSGTPTIDVGSSSLDTDTEATLSDVGYQNPAPVCAFAVSGADAVVDALASRILSSDPAMLVYRIGR